MVVASTGRLRTTCDVSKNRARPVARTACTAAPAAAEAERRSGGTSARRDRRAPARRRARRPRASRSRARRARRRRRATPGARRGTPRRARRRRGGARARRRRAAARPSGAAAAAAAAPSPRGAASSFASSAAHIASRCSRRVTAARLRREHHRHAAPLEDGRAFRVPDLLHVVGHALEQRTPAVRMLALAPAKEDDELHLRALPQELGRAVALPFVVVLADLRPEPHLLERHVHLVAPARAGLSLLLVAPLAVVHDAADGRVRGAATSTRSRSRAYAYSRASSALVTPSCSPSVPTRRTSCATIWSLIFADTLGVRSTCRALLNGCVLSRKRNGSQKRPRSGQDERCAKRA